MAPAEQAAGDHQLVLTARRRRERRIRLEQSVDVFPHVEAAEVEDVLRTDTVALTHRFDHPPVDDWAVTGVDSVANHVNAILRDLKHPHDVALRILRYGDDCVGPPHSEGDER